MIGVAALVLAAAFAGAAIYVSFVEHPARMTLPPAQALAEWVPSYKRGYVLQASVAALAGLAGIVVWWRWGAPLHLAGALLILAPWPWTLFVIMPVNKRLLALGKDATDSEIRTLLARWAQLHLVRTALGIAATASFALPLIRL